MIIEYSFPWQQANWELFNQYLIQNRIPQALLINGAKGLGKQALALSFAKALLCTHRLQTGQGCGLCKPCKLFTAQTHPDFITLSPEDDGKIIGIDMIRQLILKLALKPQFEAYRVVLISPADKLNHAGANAFLKCLEEPNERTCVMLLTAIPSKLPVTILSRCQKMSLVMPKPHIAKTWLLEQGVVDNTEIILNLAQGAPLLAKEYAQMNILPLHQQCFSDWLNVINAQINPIEIAEKWYKQPTTMILFWQISWVVDLVKCYYQTDVINLYNPDLQINLQALVHKLNLKKVYHLYDLLLQNLKKLETSINSQLMFEELLILGSQLTLR